MYHPAPTPRNPSRKPPQPCHAPRISKRNPCVNLVYAILCIQTRFTWDELKDRSNRRKHGISFETATRVFLDPLHISIQDRVVEGEERWQTIGMVDGMLVILVAYTVIDGDEELIRIISARKATRQERIEYEEANEI